MQKKNQQSDLDKLRGRRLETLHRLSLLPPSLLPSLTFSHLPVFPLTTVSCSCFAVLAVDSLLGRCRSIDSLLLRTTISLYCLLSHLMWLLLSAFLSKNFHSVSSGHLKVNSPLLFFWHTTHAHIQFDKLSASSRVEGITRVLDSDGGGKQSIVLLLLAHNWQDTIYQVRMFPRLAPIPMKVGIREVLHTWTGTAAYLKA